MNRAGSIERLEVAGANNQKEIQEIQEPQEEQKEEVKEQENKKEEEEEEKYECDVCCVDHSKVLCCGECEKCVCIICYTRYARVPHDCPGCHAILYPSRLARDFGSQFVKDIVIPQRQKYLRHQQRIWIRIDVCDARKQELLQPLQAALDESLTRQQQLTQELNGIDKAKNPVAFALLDSDRRCVQAKNDSLSDSMDEFVMPPVAMCANSECFGWIDPDSIRCGLCGCGICSTCGDLMPVDQPHLCSPDTVESFKTKLKDCKRCPLCNVFIQKKDGCDRMLCSNEYCKAKFSWETLELYTGNDRDFGNEQFHSEQRRYWGDRDFSNKSKMTVLAAFKKMSTSLVREDFLRIVRCFEYFNYLIESTERPDIVKATKDLRGEFIAKRMKLDELETRVGEEDWKQMMWLDILAMWRWAEDVLYRRDADLDLGAFFDDYAGMHKAIEELYNITFDNPIDATLSRFASPPKPTITHL